MTMTALDTLKFVRALKAKAHLSTEQAEGFADAFSEALESDLVTKSDLAVAVSELKAIIADAKTDTIKWVCGLVGFQTVVTLGGVVALLKLAH